MRFLERKQRATHPRLLLLVLFFLYITSASASSNTHHNGVDLLRQEDPEDTILTSSSNSRHVAINVNDFGDANDFIAIPLLLSPGVHFVPNDTLSLLQEDNTARVPRRNRNQVTKTVTKVAIIIMIVLLLVILCKVFLEKIFDWHSKASHPIYRIQ